MLLCPWAAGGGTDQVSREVAALLEQELDVPVNVVNATGGAGVTGHTRGALARPDGYTLTMVTVEINMLHWRGLTSISPWDFEPVGLLNRDAAAMFVRSDAPWETLEDLGRFIEANPGRLKASGTATGGIWHLGFAGWLTKIGVAPSAAIWVSINGAGPSLQELIAGGVDAVCVSLPEAQSLLDADRIRCLGVMADGRLESYPDVPTFKEQGVDWTLTGWRGVCLPKGAPPEVTARLVGALERAARSENFRTFMQNAGFDARWEPPQQFAETMRQVDEQLGALLTSDAFRSLHRSRFGPMFFPWVLMAILAAVFIGLIATGGFKRAEDVEPLIGQGLLRAAAVVAWVAAYLLAVEWAGFVLTAGVLLAVLLRLFGSRWPVAVGVSAILVPLTYQLFAVSLRVPLPQGWLGW